MLVFCLAWCVQRRLECRDRARLRQQAYIRGVAQAKQEMGFDLEAVDIEGPLNVYFFPSEPVCHDAASVAEIVQHETAIRWTRRCAVASWLFYYLHDDVHDPRVRNRAGTADERTLLSAVVPLRASCKRWQQLLPGLRCCDCGQDYRVGDFRGWWCFAHYGAYGPLPCQECFGICTSHLSCQSCQNKDILHPDSS